MVMALDLVDGEIFMENVSQRSGWPPCTCTHLGRSEDLLPSTVLRWEARNDLGSGWLAVGWLGGGTGRRGGDRTVQGDAEWCVITAI